MAVARDPYFNRGKRSKHSRGKSILQSSSIIHHPSLKYCLPVSSALPDLSEWMRINEAPFKSSKLLKRISQHFAQVVRTTILGATCSVGKITLDLQPRHSEFGGQLSGECFAQGHFRMLTAGSGV